MATQLANRISGKSSRKLDDIANELERGVFLAVYHSKKQHRRRFFAGLLLGLKHSLRGLLFSWPLYLLPFSALALPGQYKYLFILFLLPGVYVSVLILKRGVSDDYAKYVEGRLLSDGYSSHLLWVKDSQDY